MAALPLVAAPRLPLWFEGASNGAFIAGRHRLTAGTLQLAPGLAKLDRGGAVLWSTLLAGSATDEARGIAVDAAGNAYVAGWTNSPDFPGASGLPTAGRPDAFIAKISSDGAKLVYSTLLGGAGDDRANAVAVHPGGMAYVAGRDGTGPGGSFVAEIGPGGEKSIYTVLAGSAGWAGDDTATAIGLWQTGFLATGIWVAGKTGVADFPLMQPLQPSSGPGSGSYLASLVPVGDRFARSFSTYYGWTSDTISALAAGSLGRVWIGGGASLSRIDLSPTPPANPGTPEIGAVYNAASYRLADRVAPGEIVTLFGTDFDGAIVTVGGLAAKVYYAGPGQINFVVPPEIQGTEVDIVVRRGGRVSAPRHVAVKHAVPGIFTVVHSSDYSPVTARNPIRRGEYISIFCTGLGVQAPQVAMDDRITATTFAGPAPGFPGLDQINLRIGNDERPGAKLLYVSVFGESSNRVPLYVE